MKKFSSIIEEWSFYNLLCKERGLDPKNGEVLSAYVDDLKHGRI